MIKIIKNLLIKYKELILYCIFGVLTTLVNILVYQSFNLLGVHELISNIIAWIAAVAFAFITNKLFVFESKSFAPAVFWPELVKFALGRVATGLLDEALIAYFVTYKGGNELLWKIISNIVVIILNFVISKLLIFKNSKKNEK